MNVHILTPEVQQYLREQEAASPTDVALRKSPFAGVSSRELAQQIDVRQRCRKKLPHWYETPGIYYPAKISVEQASSELTAAYKATLVSAEQRLIDLTGGMGVDALFFARKAQSVVHCETQAALSAIARHNAARLDVNNLTFEVTDGMAYLQEQSADAFDCVYIDPSRRVSQRKVFRLTDCEPDVVAAQEELLQCARKNIIKCAPLLDISAALEQLSGVREIHLVSVDNECKELLLVRDRDFDGVPQLVVAALRPDHMQTLRFDVTTERMATAELGDPETYLYEPDAALLKSGAFKFTAQHYGIRKLHTHTHLYTSAQRVSDFIGKVYRVDRVMPYAAFKKSKEPVVASVATRNFPLKVDALRQRHRIRDGGETHLFFCTGMDGQLLVIFTSKS